VAASRVRVNSRIAASVSAYPVRANGLSSGSMIALYRTIRTMGCEDSSW